MPCLPCAVALAATPAAPIAMPLAGLAFVGTLLLSKSKGRTTGLDTVTAIAVKRHPTLRIDPHPLSNGVRVGGLPALPLTHWIGIGLVGLFGLSIAMLARAGRSAPPPSAIDIARTEAWSDEDYRSLAAGAKRNRMNPADELVVIHSESGGEPWAAYRVDADEKPTKDPSGRIVAVGLTQLTRVSNGASGLSEADRLDLVNQPVSVQLPIVERVFASLPWTKAGRSYDHAGLIYMGNFAPGLMLSRGTSPDTVLYTEAKDGDNYRLNKGFDTAKKGFITMGDLIEHLRGTATNDVYQSALVRLRYATGDASLAPNLPE